MLVYMRACICFLWIGMRENVCVCTCVTILQLNDEEGCGFTIFREEEAHRHAREIVLVQKLAHVAFLAQPAQPVLAHHCLFASDKMNICMEESANKILSLFIFTPEKIGAASR